MLNKLQQMDKNRRAQLINAVIDEFSRYPFDKASTNSIVKKAGISKGLLFHYFKDKKDLFDTTAEYVIRLMIQEFAESISLHSSDIFERIRDIALVKVEISRRHPGFFKFIINLFKDQNQNYDLEEAKDRYRAAGMDVDALMTRIYSENIDFSLFADQDSIQESIEIINWTMEGVTKKLIDSGMLQREEVFENHMPGEIDKYIKVLRKTFYKQEDKE